MESGEPLAGRRSEVMSTSRESHRVASRTLDLERRLRILSALGGATPCTGTEPGDRRHRQGRRHIASVAGAVTPVAIAVQTQLVPSMATEYEIDFFAGSIVPVKAALCM
jgi:hypothetical protein